MSLSYIIGTRDGKYLSIKLEKVVFTGNVNLASCFESLDELNRFEDENPNLYSELTYPYIIDGKNKEIREVVL